MQNSRVEPSLRKPPFTARELSALERKCSGTGWRFVCRHPDIDGDPIDETTRTCVIDRGEPEQCEMSCRDAGEHRVTDKVACEFWRKAPRRAPAGLDPETALRLIGMARASLNGRKDGSSNKNTQPSQGEEP